VLKLFLLDTFYFIFAERLPALVLTDDADSSLLCERKSSVALKPAHP